jgi:hypothetical protein
MMKTIITGFTRASSQAAGKLNQNEQRLTSVPERRIMQ